jgi:TetR/AcrR family transcriptional regulator, cholesterol catabolism regulator
VSRSSDRTEAAPRRNGPASPRDVRDEIVKQAAALFDERGYHQASMEDIAEAVGLRKPTLYHYFKSKSEILFWIHEEFIDLLIDRHERRLRSPLGPEQMVLEIMADILELMDTHRGHVRVFFEHHRELPPEQHAAIARKRLVYRQAVTEVIQRGIDEGVFRPVDAKFATLALFGMCNWAYQWYRADGQLRSREIGYVFWDMLLRGLAAPDAR